MTTNNGFTNWPTELVVMNIMNDSGLYQKLVRARFDVIWQDCRNAFKAHTEANPLDYQDLALGFFGPVNWREVAHEVNLKRTDLGL